MEPETPEIAQQIDWLHQFTKARIQWRKRILFYLKRNRITPLFSLKMAK